MASIGGTNEVRDLVIAGEIKPGDKAIDRPVDSMTDREILEETLIHLRNQRDVVGGLVEQVMASPMGKMIGGFAPTFPGGGF